MNKSTLLLLMAIVFAFACHRKPAEKYKPEYSMIEQSKIIGDTAYFSIDLQYPLFNSADNSKNTGLDLLNKRMAAFLDTAANYYWGTDADGARKVIDETGAHGKYELLNRYEALSKEVNLISVKFETYSYALGAHGFTAITTFNFDVKNSKFLELTDFISINTAEEQNTLNALLVKYLENPQQCFDKEPSVGKEFENFGVTMENMIFYFEAYELGAYYCGAAAIKIPIKVLKESGIWKWKENSEEARTA